MIILFYIIYITLSWWITILLLLLSLCIIIIIGVTNAMSAYAEPHLQWVLAYQHDYRRRIAHRIRKRSRKKICLEDEEVSRKKDSPPP